MAILESVSYRAVRIRQTSAGGWLILFAAPATEIDIWAGIPQKKKSAVLKKQLASSERKIKNALRSLSIFTAMIATLFKIRYFVQLVRRNGVLYSLPKI
jgi:hypothetical protein